MISQAESLLHIAAASLISTGLLAFGLRGTRPGEASRTRRRRWPSLLGGAFGVLLSAFTGLIDGFRINDAATLAFTLATLTVMAIVAGVLLRLGLRGRRVGDHPYCAACGFDLFGKPPESNLCNECGADLSRNDAIVVGTRQRRMLPLSCGLFLLILTLAVSLPTGRDLYRRAANNDWTPYKPTRWLLRDYAANPRKNDVAGNELWRRLEADSLDAEAIRAFIAAARGRPPLSFVPPYLGTLWIESSIAQLGFKHGKVDEQTMRAMLQKSLDLHLEVAAQASRGNTLRYWISSPDISMARDPNPERAQFAMIDRHVTINGVAVPSAAIDLSPFPNPTWRWVMLKGLGDRIHLDALPSPLAAGPANIEMHITATATLALTGRPTLIETKECVLTGTTQIVEPAAMSCAPITDRANPLLPDDDPINMTAAPGPLSAPDPPPAIDKRISDQPGKWTLTVNGLRAGAILGDAFLRVGNTEQPLGPIYLPANESFDFTIDQDPPPEASLLIRPTPQRGAELFDVVKTYQLPLTIPIE